MRTIGISLVLMLTGCVTAGDIFYHNLQTATDKNGLKTFDFYYTQAMIDSYANHGGKQAMLDFFIAKEIAKHDFCRAGYTLLNTKTVDTGYFMQHGQCK